MVISSVIIGDNFEDSAIGDKSYGWYADYSSVETECVFSGKKSLKLSLNQGRESPICGGNSNYGWRIALPVAIPEGYNIWYSAKFYFPSTLSLGYVFQSSDYDEAKNQCGSEVSDGFGWLKFLVLGPDQGSGSTARLYYQLPSRRRDVGSNSGVRLANEPASNILDSNFTIPRNKWVTLQMHVFVHSGDAGFIRYWVDDNYLGQLNGKTIDNSDIKISEWGIGPYFNGLPYTDGENERDFFYIDDVIVTSDYGSYGSANAVDTHGNSYIDPATGL